MELEDSVLSLKGVGPASVDTLASAGIKTIADLLDYFPRQYNDYKDVTSITNMKPGLVTIKVKFENISARQVRRGIHITTADAVDDTGRVRVVWFNQSYRAKSLKSVQYLLHGLYEFKNNRLQIVNPSIELFSELSDISSIMPTYPERSGLKNLQIKKIISNLFKTKLNIPESLPKEVMHYNNLIDLSTAYNFIHLPRTVKDLEQAKRRFAFEELFVVMLASSKMKQNNNQVESLAVAFSESAAKKFVSELEFNLTDSQRAVVWQIYKDMQLTIPMNRLVEGDVGSGKTVVAVMSALMALENGLQVAFIAPTEILAQQHYLTIKKLLKHTKYHQNIDLLTGSTKLKIKKEIKENIKSGKSFLIVGTHALLEESIDWYKLGLVVIDEQHRFGVEQRQKLHAKAKHMPHVLCLTATPIPRSLALTVYGELDISILSQAPTNKAGYQTAIVSPNSTTKMYDHIKNELALGRQAYVVCPLINKSEVLEVESAEEVYKKLSQKELKDFKLGLLHGRMKPSEKEAVMQDFKDGKLDVLISTTVIEVGVDVHNASIMVILSADRFGLAQLHQLRGRIGRGKHKGYCYLVMSDSNVPSKRLKALESTSDGFKLAEIGLKLRGPGAIYGKRQHGQLDLKFVDLTDHILIAEVRSAVNQFINSGQDVLKYHKLAAKLHRALQLTYLN